MAISKGLRVTVGENERLRRLVSRAFIVSIILYFVIIAYLVAESIMGASRWEPYGVNIGLFIALVIVSEAIVTATAVWIFKEDTGIWPPEVAEGWRELKGKQVRSGARKLLSGAWDVSLIDLRLRTPSAIWSGRINRIAALVPLAYALLASTGGAPWGLRASALVDIGLTLAVWALMEVMMVRPAGTSTPARAASTASTRPGVEPTGRKESSYYVRPLTEDDIPRVAEIERIKWREQAATADMIRSRLRMFPEGQLAAIHVTSIGGVPVRESIVAWSTIAFSAEATVRSFGSWNNVTAGGTIESHDPDGEVVIGVNLTSVTEGATYLLLGEILASVVEWGKVKLIGGSRLNGYAAFNERRAGEGKAGFSPDQYARLKEIRGYRLNEHRIDDGERPLSDRRYVSFVRALRTERGEAALQEEERPDYVCSNVRGYLSIPGARLVSVMARYFEDPASESYGVVMEWPNPLPRALMQTTWLRRLVARRIRNEIVSEWEKRRQRMRRLSERRRTAQHVPEYLRRGVDEAQDIAPEAVPLDAANIDQDAAKTRATLTDRLHVPD
jgi:hypothetical protein